MEITVCKQNNAAKDQNILNIYAAFFYERKNPAFIRRSKAREKNQNETTRKY